MIKSVVFDVGCVVWDFKPLFTQLKTSWARALGFSPRQFIALYNRPDIYQNFETNKLSLEKWFYRLQPNCSTADLLSQIDSTFSDPLVFDRYFDRQVVDIISRLHQNPAISVGALSNVENFFRPHWVSHFQPLFDFSILSCDVGLRKPDPLVYQEIFKHASPRHNPEPLSRAEVIFIDDKPENVASAKHFGLTALLFVDSASLTTALSSYQLP